MPVNLFSTRKLLLIVICLNCFPTISLAADNRGQFALRGAGLMPCVLFTQERSATSTVYVAAASWIDGYLSGTNQYKPHTYDALSFESSELIMSIIDKHCKKNPDDPVFGVISNLFKKLHQDRLTTKSEKKELTVAERKTSLYVEVLKRAQQALHKKGFYNAKIDGLYNQHMVRALKDYQLSIGFKASGFPDQITLWRLLRDSE